MFIFKTAKVWRDLAHDTPDDDDRHPTGRKVLTENLRGDTANTKGNAQHDTAPKIARAD